MTWPPAEIEITPSLVRRLLAEQHPHLAELEIEEVGYGFDNSIWRLGSELVVRLPRRSVAATLMDHELRWLPGLAGDLPLDTSVALYRGRSGQYFPWPWAVARWIDGRPGDEVDVVLRSESAGDLARFLRALHRPAPDDAPTNEFRGVALDQMTSAFRRRVDELAPIVNRRLLLQLWQSAVDAEPWNGVRQWIHGDPHPANLIFRGGRLVGVIDFGDLCVGDPATDLAGSFLSLSYGAVEEFMRVYGPINQASIRRSVGWALHFSVMFLALGQSGRTSYGSIGTLGLENATSFATTAI